MVSTVSRGVLAAILGLAMFASFAFVASAHPAVPEQSIGNVSENSATGMATAGHKDKGGVADHVFEQRFLPVFPH